MSDIIEKIDELKSYKSSEEILDGTLQIIIDLSQRVQSMEKTIEELTEYAEYIESRLDDASSLLEGFEEEVDSFEYKHEEDDYIESSCPFCDETLFIEEQLFKSDSEIKCPNCNNTMKLQEKYLEPIKK
ncbi:hypothetical protein KQI89_03210 [Clostridium sp. MSJ-4]|uniref:AraC family transcriptional regulator n=1 Tax=Clostridium simiarum TaxID=2841506 RepID=A0ABS6EX14_9CLOT|nr:hypothetical protein [Clostridium simiarum]MBU5590761.1 hypothetical protein [Clostridium simiarum]